MEKPDGSDVNEVKMMRYSGIIARKYSANKSLPRFEKKDLEFQVKKIIHPNFGFFTLLYSTLPIIDLISIL
jgi:hypothetical protein